MWRQIKTPFGTFYGSNITPDAETGIGRWSDAEIVAAIRTGDARGEIESPVMPYAQYAGMADADVGDLVAYLRTLAPVRRANREAEVSVPWPTLAYRAWRLMFASRLPPPAQSPADALARGKYLVEHIALCPDCHTPRTRLGALDTSLWLAGVTAEPGGHSVPNITPEDDTGIADWSEKDIVRLLQTGMKPNMDNVQGAMADVVEGVGGGPGYDKAPEEELRSIAKYLRTVPPIRHEVGGE